jgi:hypothetical protein
MNKARSRLWIAGVCVLGMALASAFGATANLTEKWDAGLDSWSLATGVPYGGGAIVYSGTNLAVGFDALTGTPPPNERGGLNGATVASAGRFAGDYVGSGITAISFDYKVVGTVARAWFYFRATASGREWQYALPNGPLDWTHMAVPLTYASWVTPLWYPRPTEADFRADLGDVGDVGIGADRLGLDAQACYVDNLKLTGPWGGPKTADGMCVSWLQEYLGVSDGLYAKLDSFHTGFSNMGLMMMNTAPGDIVGPGIEIARNGNGDKVLRWKHSAQCASQFEVLRTSDLNSPFQPVKTDIQSTGSMNEEVLQETDGPYFYKIGVK